MILIGLEIIVTWILMGIIIAVSMYCCLQIAVLCEKIFDYVSKLTK